MSRSALVLLFVLAALGIFALWRVHYHLPDPEGANRQQVFRWLVARDLRSEPLHVRHALMERLQDELQDAPPTETGDAAVPKKYEEQLRSNADLLAQLWFETRVNQYHALSRSQRVAFLQEQIDALLTWTRMRQNLQDAPATASRTAESSSSTTIAAFFRQIESWIAEADDETSRRMSRAVRDGVVVWLATSELHSYDGRTQRTLALRLAAALGRGRSGPGDALPLTAAQTRQLAENARLLVQAWFFANAELYHELPVEERAAFIDERLEELTAADVLSLLASDEKAEDGLASRALIAAQLLKTVEGWIAEAPEAERSDLRAFATQLQQRLLWRQFQRLLSAS